MSFFRRGRAGKEKKPVYEEVSQSELLYSKRKFGLVVVRGTVSGKPKLLTMRGIFGGMAHEHTTVFSLEKGVNVYFPGIAFLKDGEEVSVYGRFTPPNSLAASKIETKNVTYELQLE
ncbi:MAG: hypothetical protein QW039_04970 [Fervidicoccaceae archaeon]